MLQYQEPRDVELLPQHVAMPVPALELVPVPVLVPGPAHALACEAMPQHVPALVPATAIALETVADCPAKTAALLEHWG